LEFFKIVSPISEKEQEEFRSTLMKYKCPEKKVVTLEKFTELMKDGVVLYGFKLMKKNLFDALTENKDFDENMGEMENEEHE
jgi:hypothetical protein